MKINCVIRSTYFLGEETRRTFPPPRLGNSQSRGSAADRRRACGRVSMPLKSHRNKIERGEEDGDELEPNGGGEGNRRPINNGRSLEAAE